MAKWSGDRLWYLLNLSQDDLKIVFMEYPWSSLRVMRRIYKLRVDNGETMSPERPKDYNEKDSPETIRERLKNPLGKSALIEADARKALHTQLDEAIDAHNINPGAISKIKVSGGSHTGFIKNEEGKIEYTEPLKRKGFSFDIEARKLEPQWETIRQIDYKPLPFLHKERKRRPKNQGTAVILPDPQIGFRRYADGSVEAFHDEEAIGVALSIINDVQPSEVIFLGDILDLPAFGRFEQSEDYAHTTNTALAYTCQLLDTIRAVVGPKAKITILEGNHERRIEKQNKANLLANFSLRQEGDVSNFPVLSVPHLLNLKKRKIEYVEGYPAGKYWLNERLQIIHGHVVKSNASTAAAIVKQEDATTIFGHVHRIESQYKTQNTYNGARTIAAHTPGCLCRIDGVVPSTKGGTRLDGKHVENYENWQQGISVVEFEKGDGTFNYENIFINTHENYKAMFRGKVYGKET